MPDQERARETSLPLARRKQEAQTRVQQVASRGVRDVQDIGRIISAAFADLGKGQITPSGIKAISLLSNDGLRTAEILAEHGNIVLNPEQAEYREGGDGERNTGDRSRDERD